MKKRLAFILAAALLLSGCGDEEQSVAETSEQPSKQTAEQTIEQTTAGDTSEAIKYPEYPEFVEHYGAYGDVQTNGASELRAFFSGADEYCGFGGLGVRSTYHSGFLHKAKMISMDNEGFDPNFDGRAFGSCLGVEDGSFYFSVDTTYNKPDSDGFYEITYREDYFCFSCDTGVLEQVFPPEGYESIEAMGRSFMLCHGESGYAVADRHTDKIYELPYENISRQFFVGNDLYITTSTYLPEHSANLYVLRWLNFDSGTMSDIPMVQPAIGIYPAAERGVYNLVYREYGFLRNNYSVFTLNGNEYLASEPHGRVKDFVSETYYRCSAAAVPNRLGYTTHLTLTDRSDSEHILGSVFTEDKPQLAYTDSFDIHATKDGLVYLNVEDFEPIMLKWDEETDRISAAFIPELYVPEYSTVLCDGERLYFYGNSADDIAISMITAEEK